MQARLTYTLGYDNTGTYGSYLGTEDGNPLNFNIGAANKMAVSSVDIGVSGFLDVAPSGTAPTGYPTGWGGGIHTWDVYANGTVGMDDTSGNLVEPGPGPMVLRRATIILCGATTCSKS